MSARSLVYNESFARVTSFLTSVGLMVLIVSVLAGLASAVGVSAARGGVGLAVGAGVAVGLAMFFGWRC